MQWYYNRWQSRISKKGRQCTGASRQHWWRDLLSNRAFVNIVKFIIVTIAYIVIVVKFVFVIANSNFDFLNNRSCDYYLSHCVTAKCDFNRWQSLGGHGKFYHGWYDRITLHNDIEAQVNICHSNHVMKLLLNCLFSLVTNEVSELPHSVLECSSNKIPDSVQRWKMHVLNCKINQCYLWLFRKVMECNVLQHALFQQIKDGQ